MNFPRLAPLLLLLACRTQLPTPECDTANPCPALAEPCRESYCTASGTCATRPLHEARSCGPLSDCASTKICRAGQCVVSTDTNGARCAEPTPCRAQGTCQGGACMQPEASQPATPLWSIPPVALQPGISALLADRAGNFYWQECPDAYICEKGVLVSVEPGGRERYRVPIQGVAALSIAGDKIVRAGFCHRDAAGRIVDGSIEARSLVDGAFAWTLDYSSVVPAAPDKSCRTAGTQTVFDGASTLYGQVGWASSITVPGKSNLVAIDIQNGAIRWARPYEGHWTGALVGDDQGGLYFPLQDQTIAVDANGVERWRADYLNFPVAAGAGRLWTVTFVTGDGKMHFLYTAYDVRTGKQVYELGPRQIRAMPLKAPLLSATSGFAFDGGNEYTQGEALTGFDGASGKVQWRFPLALGGHAAAATDSLRTNRGSIVFLQEEFSTCDDNKCSYLGAHLREVSEAGKEQWSCEVPIGQYTYRQYMDGEGTLALGDELLAVQGGDGVIRGYAVGGAGAAEDGWSAARGNMARSGRAMVR